MNYLRMKKKCMNKSPIQQYLEREGSALLTLDGDTIIGGEAGGKIELPCGDALKQGIHWEGSHIGVNGILATIKDGHIIAPWFISAWRGGDHCLPHWNIKECRQCPLGGCCDCIARGGNDCTDSLSISIVSLKAAIAAVPIPITFGSLEVGETFKFPKGTHFYQEGEEYVKVGDNSSFRIDVDELPGLIWGCDQEVVKTSVKATP